MESQQVVYERMKKLRVVPVVAVDSVNSALPLADALVAGGLPVAEVTFRTRAAAEVIRILSERRPDMLIGAGTILNTEDLRRARDCGASFGVAPGLNPVVVSAAVKIGMAFAPGVMTPSEVDMALALGVTTLKFFPAEAAGGINMLKSIHSPYRHLGVRFIPTGGINADNMLKYLALDAVLAVGGTWIADRETIAAGDWSKITDTCRQVLSRLGST